MRAEYTYAIAAQAESRTKRLGFAWHSLTCICQDCLDADWHYVTTYSWAVVPSDCSLFEVKR